MRIVIDMQGAQTRSRVRGIGRYTLSLVHAILRNKGDHEIFILLSGLFPDGIKELQREFEGLLSQGNIKIWNGFGHYRYEESNENLSQLSIAEKKREAFLAELKPDVVLITSLFDDEAITSIGCTETFPTAVIFYDLYPLIKPDSFQLRKPVRERYFRRLGYLKKADLLLAISESARQEALSYFDFDSEAVVNIFGGACIKKFHISKEAIPKEPQQSSNRNIVRLMMDRLSELWNDEDSQVSKFFGYKSAKEEVWEKFGISKPFVMYAGTYEERKNLERLIKAYSLLEDKIREDHQLVFVGPISPKEIKGIARNCGLIGEEFLLLGHVSDKDMFTLYNSCALFVLPSLYEGLGLPAMEAMLCGAPVIGSNKTSLPEVIGLEEALFDPYSVEEMCSKISRALTEEQFRALLLEHGKKQSGNFSWDMSAKRALRAMEKLVSKRATKESSQLIVQKKKLFRARKLRILAIKLDHLGDFILTIPALMKLKARYPHATFDLIIGSWNVPLAKSLGMFDKIFTCDFLKTRTEKSTQDRTQKEWDELLGNLETYDIAIDFRRHPDGRILLTKTKALLKVGYQTQRQEIDQVLNIALPTALDRPFEMTEKNQIPMSQQLLALVDALPKDDNDFILLPEIVKDRQPQTGSVAIFPKAGSEVKEWAVSKFYALIQKLLNSPQVDSIDLYFANQEEASDFNMTHPKIQTYVGLQFQELAESLAKNKICITNDSGGGHLAAYLGVTPLVIFSGRDSVDEWGPQFNESYIISHKTHCAPCHLNKKKDCFNAHNCLDGISVEDVYSLTLELLGSKAVSAL